MSYGGHVWNSKFYLSPTFECSLLALVNYPSDAPRLLSSRTFNETTRFECYKP